MTERNLSSGVSRRAILKAAVTGAATLGAPNIARAATELRYMNHETEPRTIIFLKALAAEYKDATGVSVLVETEADPWVKLTTSIKAGKPYDFMSLPSITHPVLLAQTDSLTALTDIVKEQGLSDFGPRCLPYYKNEIWGYPYDYNLVCLNYRTDWLSDKGLKVPTDWPGFLEVLEAFNDPKNKRYAYTQTVTAGSASIWNNTGFLWANDIRLYDDKWAVILDQPEMKARLIECLQFIKKTAAYSPPGLFSVGLKEIIANFVSGTVGIAPYSGRLIHNVEDNAPDLASRIALGPYMRPKGGHGVVTGGVDVFAIGATPKAEEAKKFFRWMIKNDKITDFQLTLPLHYQPPQFSTYENKRWASHPLVVKHKDKLDVMKGFLFEQNVKIEAIQYQGPEFSPNQGRLYNSNLVALMFQNVIADKMTPEEAAAAGAARVRELTDKS
jgi:multiple sugar transport system substrate-binding protein